MKIIAIVNEKGGTGKSTISTNLATALHRRGSKVVLIDADPQGTARDWREGSPEGAHQDPGAAHLLHSAMRGHHRGCADFPAVYEARNAH